MGAKRGNVPKLVSIVAARVIAHIRRLLLAPILQSCRGAGTLRWLMRSFCIRAHMGCLLSCSLWVRVGLAGAKASSSETLTLMASPSPPTSTSEVSGWSIVQNFLVMHHSLFFSIALLGLTHYKVCSLAMPSRFVAVGIMLSVTEGRPRSSNRYSRRPTAVRLNGCHPCEFLVAYALAEHRDCQFLAVRICDLGESLRPVILYAAHILEDRDV